MKLVKLSIDLDFAKAGDSVEMMDSIANQFILKGWAVETSDPVKEPDPEPKKERAVIGKIKKA
jgi:hypothetical protein